MGGKERRRIEEDRKRKERDTVPAKEKNGGGEFELEVMNENGDGCTDGGKGVLMNDVVSKQWLVVKEMGLSWRL